MIFKNKARRLKNEGLRYDAEILKIVTNYMVIIGFSTLAHLECSYQNENGETCMVKSKSFMIPFSFDFLSKNDVSKKGYQIGKSIKYLYNDGKRIEATVVVRRDRSGVGYVLFDCTAKYLINNIKVVVYVNRNDPMDYHVEVICRK